MIATGLTPPSRAMSLGGVMPVKSLSVLMGEEKAAMDQSRSAMQDAQNQPVITGLAAHIRAAWTEAKDAKRQHEQDMLAAVRARRGEYDPQILSQIRKQGGSEIYMMIFATKAAQLKALYADILTGTGTDRPWTLKPSPVPELAPEDAQQIMQGVYEEVMQAEMTGMPMSVQAIRQMMYDAKSAMTQQTMEMARRDAEDAEAKVEDVLVEGGFAEALDEFVDDLTTFKTAILKGPVVHKVNELAWQPGPDGRSTPVITARTKLHFKRVDPFKLFPAKNAKSVHDGPLIELHDLSRADLSAMIGVDGYDDAAIREVLREHGDGGLHEWLDIDAERAHAEGRDTDSYMPTKVSPTIAAIQYWGSVSGKMLRDWGMDESQVPDEAKEYEVEAWMIGSWVIKAVINPDPLQRRPYYTDGFRRIPGAFWHNSLYDSIRDVCDMANGAARALSNNMGMSSGPMAAVNIDRLAQGEELTEMYPWRMFQTVNDPMGSSAPPVQFFQPSSNANELMMVFEKFSMLADEYSGIPRYMAGIAGGEGGAGRTASGMSMMITNASKQVKHGVASLDMNVIGPAVERTYQWIIQYMPDKQIRGDLQAQARGALSLVAKESAQVRLNEFLNATANPIDMQIVGMEGRAELLRHAVRRLDVNTDKVVPSETAVKLKAFQAQQAQVMQQQAALQQSSPEVGGGQELMDGAPTTDNFQPA